MELLSQGCVRMTQENKFALIIGFALLLVVGILVSDHLAEVARGAPANLAVKVDPMAAHPAGRIEFQPLLAARSAPEADPLNLTNAPEPATTGTDRLHAVGLRETLTSIAVTYYGQPELAMALARHNELPNPDRLKAGVRLIIPPQALLLDQQSTNSALAPRDTAANQRDTFTTYTVRSGDTLSELSQQLMGSTRDMNRLISLNPKVLSNPDALRVGMVLRYPTQIAATTP